LACDQLRMSVLSPDHSDFFVSLQRGQVFCWIDVGWLHKSVGQVGDALETGLVPVEFFALSLPVLRVDIQRLLETLIRLIVVTQQVLQLFLFNLLLVGDRLQHGLVVLRCPQVNKHRRVY